MPDKTSYLSFPNLRNFVVLLECWKREVY